jgi:outer membrane protein
MNILNKIRSLALLISLTLNMPVVAAQDIGSLLQQAESLLSQSRPAEAYQLLAPLEAQQKGDTRYDYLLGASLLESGKPALAIPVFKRVLAINPQFAAARLDLGRAHFAVGNFDEAKSAFTTAAYQNPPPAARQAIDYHLAEIEQRGKVTNFSGSAYVSATLGRDSNVSGGIENGRLFVVGFADPFILDQKNIKAPDTYFSYNAGGNLRLALDYELALFASADVSRRDNYNLRTFDSINASLQTGIEKTIGSSNLKLSGSFGRGILDYANLRRNNGGAFEWRYDLDRLNQMTWYIQSGRVRYAPPAYRSYDVDQRQTGVSWFQVSEAKGNPSLFLSAFVAKELPLDALPDGEKRTLGARLNGQIGIGSGALINSGLGFSRDQFDKERPIDFDIKPDVQPVTLSRRDQRFDFNLGLTWVPELNWSVRPGFTYTRSTSNIPIYEFTRNDFSLSVRRDFR